MVWQFRHLTPILRGNKMISRCCTYSDGHRWRGVYIRYVSYCHAPCEQPKQSAVNACVKVSTGEGRPASTVECRTLAKQHYKPDIVLTLGAVSTLRCRIGVWPAIIHGPPDQKRIRKCCSKKVDWTQSWDPLAIYQYNKSMVLR